MHVIKYLEPWGLYHEQVYHTEALMTYGEKCVVRLKWTIDDFHAGLVARCTECQAGDTVGLQQRMAAVYKSSGDEYCTNCFNTGYEGGFRDTAYITWVLVNDEPANWEKNRTGTMQVGTPPIQLPFEPEIKERDLLIRVSTWSGDHVTSEHDRYSLREVMPTSLRTGPRVADPLIYVAQTSVIENLPPEHPYRLVPVP